MTVAPIGKHCNSLSAAFYLSRSAYFRYFPDFAPAFMSERRDFAAAAASLSG